MKITDKIISIPPYISTSWDKVSLLHMSDKDLIITLKDNTRIAIPDLPRDVLEEIYNAHAHFLEHQSFTAQPTPEQQPRSGELNPLQQELNAPFRILFGTLESLTQALQHNPAYSNLAPLPQEIISKIQMLAKSLPPEELANFLEPVAGCNCMYCQISRVLRGDAQQDIEVKTRPPESPEDEVAAEDLLFEQWSVETLGNKMYNVINKLDPKEHYSVYLGDPIGCTCGKQNCEHIVAVLRH